LGSQSKVEIKVSVVQIASSIFVVSNMAKSKLLIDDVVLVTISTVVNRVLVISTTDLVDVSIAVGVTF